LAHHLETLFSRVRQGVLLLDANVAGVVQQVFDASEDCVTGLGENRPNPGFGTALQAIERLLGIEPEAADATELGTSAPLPAPLVYGRLDEHSNRVRNKALTFQARPSVLFLQLRYLPSQFCTHCLPSLRARGTGKPLAHA
jgi:hypothetical protein